MFARPHAYTLAAFASGVYRKYGAYVVGERIVPRHLFFSRDWLVKGADLRDPDYLAEELDYVRGNPLFALPGIQDGRNEVHRLAAQSIVEALLALE